MKKLVSVIFNTFLSSVNRCLNLWILWKNITTSKNNISLLSWYSECLMRIICLEVPLLLSAQNHTIKFDREFCPYIENIAAVTTIPIPSGAEVSVKVRAQNIQVKKEVYCWPTHVFENVILCSYYFYCYYYSAASLLVTRCVNGKEAKQQITYTKGPHCVAICT